jgi:hypothetical protein
MKGKTEIVVEGHLNHKWKDCFEGLEFIYEGANTLLTGNIKDESHLHGILNQIRDLNLKLISVVTLSGVEGLKHHASTPLSMTDPSST